MKSAKELFQEVVPEFKLMIDDKNRLVYAARDSIFYLIHCVIFDKQEKTYTINAVNTYLTISMELNKAIQKQIEELGWN